MYDSLVVMDSSKILVQIFFVAQSHIDMIALKIIQIIIILATISFASWYTTLWRLEELAVKIKINLQHNVRCLNLSNFHYTATTAMETQKCKMAFLWS